MRRNSVEGAWQRLLELNPFLLSMLFGQPVVIIRPSASVGGQTIAGNGTKIADFLAANSITHNAALVEIKRPNTPLLGSEYRGGVYPASRDLLGSVTQVLDQRLKLLTSIAQTRYTSKINDLDVSAVECVVVAGQTPVGEELVASFELFRSQLKDVRIVTFDELLEKLKILRELLTGERYVSNIEDDESDWWDVVGSDLEEDDSCG
nr:Shedu immune nuclease family protein [uncultured Sphingomonas sp.]